MMPLFTLSPMPRIKLLACLSGLFSCILPLQAISANPANPITAQPAPTVEQLIEAGIAAQVKLTAARQEAKAAPKDQARQLAWLQALAVAADLMLEQGSREKAARHYQEMATLLEQMLQQMGRKPELLAAQAHYHEQMAKLAKHEQKLALQQQYLQNALQLTREYAERADSTVQEQQTWIRRLHAMAQFHLSQKAYPSALPLLQKAHEILLKLQQTPATLNAFNVQQAGLDEQLAQLHIQLKKPQRALGHWQSALQLRRASLPASSDASFVPQLAALSKTMQRVAMLQKNLGQEAAGLATIQEAVQLMEGHAFRAQPSLRVELGRSLLVLAGMQGQLDQASRYTALQRAYTVFQELGSMPDMPAEQFSQWLAKLQSEMSALKP